MLVANQQELDLGRLKFGQPYSFKYVLTNKSDSEVKITKLVVGCASCTKAYTETPIVRAGGSTEVNATFTPGSTGPANKNISVAYTTGGHPSAALILKFRAIVDG